MQRKIEQIIKYLIAATFFVPLVVMAESFIFPFIVPKILLVRSLVQIMAALWVVLVITNPERYRPKMNWLSWAVLGFWMSFAVSTFVGIDWYKSFWDNHERMLGLFTITHYVLYYFIVTAVVKSREEWVWLFRIWLFSGGIVMALGIIQHWDSEFLLNRGSGRSASTLGNSIYYSGYGLFLLSVASYLYAWSDRKWNAWQYYTFAFGLLGFLGIFFGGTRGTLVGLTVGLVLIFLLYFIKSGNKRVRITLGAIGILATIFVGTLYTFRKVEFISSIPTVGRLLNTHIDAGTANTRFMAWDIAVKAWQDHKLFGWGPNNYYYAFNEYYRPEFLRSGWSETWFDNAHNVVMNALATQGAFGLVFYVVLFAAAIYSIWVGYKHKKNTLDIAVLGTGFLVAHFIHNIFVFENPTSYLFFFFVLAFFTERSYLDKEDVRGSITRPIGMGALVFALIVAVIFLYSTNYNPKRANNASLNLIRVVNSNPEAAPAFFRELIRIPSPHIDDIRNDSARTLAAVAQSAAQAGRTDLAKEMLDLAYDALSENRELHPLDIRVHIQQSQVAIQRAQIENNVVHLIDAEQMLEEARKLSPARQQILFSLAPIKIQLSKDAEAVAISEEALQLDRNISEAWWRLAAVYSDTGDNEKALATIQEAESLGLVFQNGGEFVRNSIYERAQNQGLIIEDITGDE